MLGTLIGTWAATVLSALILGFSWITRNSIRGTKERKQAWVEQSALEKAKIQVGSANLNLITPSNGALGTSVGSAKPMPSGAPELVLPAPTNGALLSPSNIMRPSESTTTLHEESPFGATQAFPSSPLLSQQSYTPTSAYPASPALSYTSYPGHMSALGLQQARPLSTVSVPPTSEDIMLRV